MAAGNRFLSLRLPGLRLRAAAGALAAVRAVSCSGTPGCGVSLVQARTASHQGVAQRLGPQEVNRVHTMPVLGHYVPRRTPLSPLSKAFYRDLRRRALNLFMMAYFYPKLRKENSKAGLPTLSLKDEVLAVYTVMNTAYARGDVAMLKDVCTQDNYSNLCERLRKRAQGYTYDLNITGASRKPAIVSMVMADLSTQKAATNYVQVVARMRTTQVLTIKDGNGHPVGKSNGEPKKVDEFVLFSRWYGPLPAHVTHPDGWAVQGKVEDSG